MPQSNQKSASSTPDAGKRPGVGTRYDKTHVEKMKQGMAASAKSTRLVGQSNPRF